MNKEIKMLVAYFSCSGVTAERAKALAEAIDAKLYEIKPKTPYTRADLNWSDKQSRSTVEMQNQSFRPAIADLDADVASNDVIFVGFPIWWYVAPTIINSFLESYDFSGKTIVPFATSGGSGFGETVARLRTSVSETAVWKDGKLLNGRQSEDKLIKWIESLGL